MPKVAKGRTKLHHSAAVSAGTEEALEEIGVVFKTPPPKLTFNPFTGEELNDDDAKSTISRMSSRSSGSRWGRDGDGQVNSQINKIAFFIKFIFFSLKTVSKKSRRQARRDFLIQRLSLSKESDLQIKDEK